MQTYTALSKTKCEFFFWLQHFICINIEKKMTLDNLVGLLIVVPLQIVKYGCPYQQVGEGHDDEGQCTNLYEVE